MAVRDLGIVTAYGYAKAGGYEGTEADFTALLGDLAITVEDLEGLTVSTTTLAPGQPATASYADGVLSLGIPEGLPGVNGEVTNASLAETLADYAKIDGYYEDLTAGNAEQLLSTIQVEDQAPYLFRTSGGSTDIGNREIDKIVGGSVVWNQQRKLNGNQQTVRGVTATPKDEHTLTLNGTATESITPTVYFSGITPMGIPSNHVVYNTAFDGKGKVNLTYLGLGYSGGHTAIRNASITKPMYGVFVFSMTIAEGTSFDNEDFIIPQFIDLTQMFGTAVADRFYAMEQANAGSGVALFRSWFSKGYYAYNTGELMSVKTSAHEMTGFNQCNEVWLHGYLNNVGAFVPSENNLSTDFFPVLPNTDYYAQFDNSNNAKMYIGLYDIEKKFIGYLPSTSGIASPSVIRTPSNAFYMRLNMGNAYGMTYKNDICINLSWSGWRNGEYEPYVKHTYPLDNIELRGVPKLVDGEIQYDGDTYESDGIVTRRYGIVDLGTLDDYEYASDTTRFRIGIGADKIKSTLRQTNIMCVPYVCKCNGESYDQSWNKVAYVSGGSVYIHDSSYTDVASFKQAMSGVMLLYELATPTTETANPYTNPQIVDDFGTERYVDEREVAVPVGHVTLYPANLRDKLQHLPDLASSDGAYLIRQTGNQMSLDLFRIPKAPTTDGTYVLKATVSGGTPTYTWEVEE